MLSKRMTRLISQSVAFIAGGVLLACTCWAQPVHVPPAFETADTMIAQAPLPPVPGPAAGGMIIGAPGGFATYRFVSSEMSIGEPVKGAPYSAEAVSEQTQILPDGNRIVNKSTSSVARDSQGRTRREQTMPIIGPWAANGEPEKLIFIDDPVSGNRYILHPNQRTVEKLPALPGKVDIATVSEGTRKVVTVRHAVASSAMPDPAGESVKTQVEATGATAAIPQIKLLGTPTDEGNYESLGAQTINGVPAEGTRVTMIIPAGQIGNERPITVVDERWMATNLKVMVKSSHSDPRFGDSKYELTDVIQAEPDPSLFDVPSDYTVREGGPPQIQHFEYRKAAPKQ